MEAKVKLRDYQAAASDAAVVLAGTAGRALVVLPTGTGKSLVLCDLVKRLGGVKPRVVFAHRDEIAAQLADRLDIAGCVVFREQGKMRTSPHQVMQASGAFAGRTAVVVASIQSMHAKRRKRWPRDMFGAVFIDEAHHACARTWRAVLDHFDCPAVGFTATAQRKGLGDIWGEVPAYQMTLSEAIELGWLVPIRVRVVMLESLDFGGLRKLYGARDYTNGELSPLMKVAMPEAIAELRRWGADRRSLSFWPGVDCAKSASEHLRSVGWRVETITGDQQLMELRRQWLRQFKEGKIQSLSSCDVLNEGVDVPSADLAYLARVSRSSILVAQQTGRVTRPSPLAGIDQAATAAERCERIAASDKPHALVMVARGMKAKVNWASPVALLRDLDSADPMIKKIEAELAGGEPGEEPPDLDAAEAAAVAREREEFEAEQDRRVRIRKRVEARKDAACSVEVDPLDWRVRPATKKQKRMIWAMTRSLFGEGSTEGLKQKMRDWTKKRAGNEITRLKIIERHRRRA